MCSRFRRLRAGAAVLGALACAPLACAGVPLLRVCADPDNAPYSLRDESGFENRIARAVAQDLHADLAFVWTPPTRGYVRKTLDANACDALVGVPAGLPGVRATAPYYRAGYVFAYRADRVAQPQSLDDPQLRTRAVGVTLIGNDMAATPAAFALAQRGVTANVVGFPAMGAGPAAQRAVDALVAGDIDIALLWGPQAGWFARGAPAPVALARLDCGADDPPCEFAIAMAVRRDDAALAERLDAALARQRGAIDAILRDYAVPRTDGR